MWENYGNEEIIYGWASIFKTRSSVTKKRDYNQDETNAFKNRIKLLELENQLLKYEVSNKQKFIDTILEHNSKLSHNIDVIPASPVTYDHHVTSEPQQIRENQNGVRSDTENVYIWQGK